MTTTREPATTEAPFKRRDRPALGLGAALIGAEEEELVLQVLRDKSPFRYYGSNPQNPPQMASTLEREFAARIGSKFALGVTSGTAAVEVALAALGVGPGDEVIVPAWSWVSCFTAIIRVGATPVLAEINDTFCLAPGEIARLKTPNTKAVLVVHYQGVAAEMDELLAEARQHGVKLLEDCAQSAGASYKGKPVGSMGDIATFSFQYHKFMTSGEGGMVVMNDPLLYERAVRMHDLGQVRPYHAQFITPQVPAFVGDQFRITELQAALALAQLRKLDLLKNHCRRMQDRVLAKISDLRGFVLRRRPDPTGDTGFEIYLRFASNQQAAEFRNQLDVLNVNCRQITGTYAQYERDYVKSGDAHHPSASPFKKFGTWPATGYRREDFPRTEALCHNYVALPMSVQYSDEDADYIGDAVCHVHAQMFG
jgi:8-amino-3,8-dideoxy-alpha-D-manno-octulosonate transaminase